MPAGRGGTAQQNVAGGRKVECPATAEQLRISGGAHAETALAVIAHGISGGAGRHLLSHGTSQRNTRRVAGHRERLQGAERRLVELELGAPHVGRGSSGEFQAHAVIRSVENRSAGGRRDGDEQIIGVVGGFGARPDYRLRAEARVDFGAGAQGAVERQEAARIHRIRALPGLRHYRINSR